MLQKASYSSTIGVADFRKLRVDGLECCEATSA